QCADTDGPVDLPAEAGGDWLLLVDEASRAFGQALSERLAARGSSATLRDVASQASGEDGAWTHCVSLIGWEDTADQAADPAIFLLRRVQDWIGHETAPRLWIVTQGGAPDGDPAQGPDPSPAQAALWGFGRVLMNEA